MKEERVLISCDGPDRNVLKLKPPMVFTLANADQLVTILDQVLEELSFDNKSPQIISDDLEIEAKKLKKDSNEEVHLTYVTF